MTDTDQAFGLLTVAMNLLELTETALADADEPTYANSAPRVHFAWESLRGVWLELTDLEDRPPVHLVDPPPDPPA